ncbi:uncharacterized protein [Eucyclogobius newberryi]|uniref:uncharacterized protein n=1 Tax=Eucyclogobius newberryi TaxID=166745 RepID=UPI003B5C39BB
MPTEAVASGSSSDENEAKPLKDFLSDYDCFMALALLTAQRSSVPDNKVGACIVKDNKVIAVGYNKVLNDDDKEKYPCECHAEIDAIMNCADVKGCTMFVTQFPCNECVKLIVQAGVESVVYLSDDPDAKPLEAEAAKKMLKELPEKYQKYKPKSKEFLTKFAKENMPPPNKKQRQNSPLNIALSDYFMAVALLTAKRSRDPRSQVGACIVKDDKVIAVGHNQMPKGEDDGEKYTWDHYPDHDNKHLYVCHAELNAIVNSTDLKGCTVYVTLFPCDKCATLFIWADVKTVVYLSDKNADRPYTKKAKKILRCIKPEPHLSEEKTLEMYLENIYFLLLNGETNPE